MKVFTRLALRGMIRRRFELGDDNHLYWTSTELNEWINASKDGVRDIAAESDPERYVSWVLVSILSGTEAYDLTSTTTGTGDSIAISGTTCTLTDAGAAFTAEAVGRWITIAGAPTAGNNGTFQITAQTSTTVSYTNASGATEAAAAATWSIAVSPSFWKELAVWVADTSTDTGYRQVPRLELDRLHRVGAPSSDVADWYYYFRGQTLYVHPAPGAAGTMQVIYQGAEADLSADTASITMTPQELEWFLLDVGLKVADKLRDHETWARRLKMQDQVEGRLRSKPQINQAGPHRGSNVYA